MRVVPFAGLALLLAAGPARAERPVLAPADAGALSAARARVAASPLQGAELLPAASYAVMREGRAVATLVSGRAVEPGAPHPGRSCFLVALRPGAEPALLMTIGSGEWEVESCLGVAAVGLLPAPAGVTARIGLIYRAAAPHTEPVEPVVVDLGAAGIAIDIPASQRASEAGAVTIPALRRLLGAR